MPTDSRPSTHLASRLARGLLAFSLAACQGVIEGPAADPSGPPPNDYPTPIPDDDTATPRLETLFTCDADGRGHLAPRLVRLTERQYARTVRAAFAVEGADALELDALPFGLVNEADRFSTRVRSYRVGDAEVEAVVLAAARIAPRAVAHLAQESPCLDDPDAALGPCLRPLVRARGAVLFHRPLTDDEVDAYVGAALASAEHLDRRIAAATPFEALLRAPQFLYRTELGEPTPDGRLELTPHELAAALAYVLTDAPPDAALREAAASGALADPETIAAEVERLLADPARSAPALRFVREYFHYGHAPFAGKSPEAFPDHDPEGLVEDADTFVRAVFDAHGRDGFLEALLSSEDVFAQASTAATYGLDEAPPEDMPTRRPGERFGLLLQPAWLVAFSSSGANLPIQRGKFIRQSFLCESLPAIPIPDIEPLAPEEGQTLRETLAEHRANPECAACHDRMDPLGLPFEQFDHLGRHRTTEQGRPVVTTGALDSSGPETDGEVVDPVDLAERLSRSPTVRQCFVRHAFEYWVGTPPGRELACALSDADAHFEAGQDFVELLARFFASEAFRFRTAPDTAPEETP